MDRRQFLLSGAAAIALPVAPAISPVPPMFVGVDIAAARSVTVATFVYIDEITGEIRRRVIGPDEFYSSTE